MSDLLSPFSSVPRRSGRLSQRRHDTEEKTNEKKKKKKNNKNNKSLLSPYVIHYDSPQNSNVLNAKSNYYSISETPSNSDDSDYDPDSEVKNVPLNALRGHPKITKIENQLLLWAQGILLQETQRKMMCEPKKTGLKLIETYERQLRVKDVYVKGADSAIYGQNHPLNDNKTDDVVDESNAYEDITEKVVDETNAYDDFYLMTMRKGRIKICKDQPAVYSLSEFYRGVVGPCCTESVYNKYILPHIFCSNPPLWENKPGGYGSILNQLFTFGVVVCGSS